MTVPRVAVMLVPDKLNHMGNLSLDDVIEVGWDEMSEGWNECRSHLRDSASFSSGVADTGITLLTHLKNMSNFRPDTMRESWDGLSDG
jgi:hypothetical protein